MWANEERPVHFDHTYWPHQTTAPDPEFLADDELHDLGVLGVGGNDGVERGGPDTGVPICEERREDTAIAPRRIE